MDLLWAKKTAKLIKLQNRSSIARSRTSYGSSDCPPELSSLSQYSPQEEENAEKWDYEEKKHRLAWKGRKSSNPWGPTMEVHEELTDAACYGRDAIWAEGFCRKAVKRTVKQVILAWDLRANNNTHSSNPSLLLRSIRCWGTYPGEGW